MILKDIKKIVVPIDFSQHSGAALKWAEYWQKQTKADVTVLHCRTFDAPPSFTLEQIDDLALQAANAEKQVFNDVVTFINNLLGHTVDWDIRVKEGDPAQIIHEQCKFADLIIMGTHGRRGLQHWMLGSVAESIIHNAKAPVLVVRNILDSSTINPEIKTILVPVNSAINDDTTFTAALNIASIFNTEIVTVHIKENHVTDIKIPDYINGTLVKHIEKTGKPAEQILTTAIEINADLIILTATYKKFLDIDILPPTITQVLRYGTVPTMVLPHTISETGEKI